MSGKYATPLRIEPGFPRRLAALVTGAYLCAGIVLALTSLPVSFRTAGILLVTVDYWRVSRYFLGLGNAGAIRSLVWHGGREWTLINGRGVVTAASLIPAWYQQPWLIILRFSTPDGRRRWLLLTRERLPADDFRRLYVRLRQVPASHGNGNRTKISGKARWLARPGR